MTSFAWRALIELAERLFAVDADEAICRTVINRAYYAAFNVARDTVERSGHVPNLHAHYHVWRWFNRPEATLPMKRLGQIGSRLSSVRTKADYEADTTLTGGDARLALRDARRLIDTLSEGH
jgi:uncharacterized protein (UPF0332 family)